MTSVSTLDENVFNSLIQYSNLSGLESVVIDGVAFVVASAPAEDRIVVFGLDQSGILTKVQEIAERTLDFIIGATAVFHDGHQYFLGAAEN